jgi:UDP-GlcNAc:undecaprenyl-phosphate GlcNAc-1-phosphate transferase
MTTSLAQFFPIILTTLLTAFVISPLMIAVTRRLGLIDWPGTSNHKRHDAPTPMAGGTIVLLSMIAAELCFQRTAIGDNLGFVLGSAIIFAFGIWDDRAGLGVPGKLSGQILAAIVLLLTGTQIHLFISQWANLPLTVLWIVGVVNAFNFVDSMDGLALGLAGVASAFFTLVTIDSGQLVLTTLSAAILGVCIGAYFYNLNPAIAFLGDSGAQLLGFLLAAIGVAYNPLERPNLSSWFVPIMVLGVPIFDMVLVVLSRLRQSAPIYRAAKDHTYHRLCKLGLAPTRSVFAMQMMGIILGFISFIALDMSVIWSNVTFAIVVLTGIGLILFFEFGGRQITWMKN